MSRTIRRVSKTGMYHIVFRGINKQSLFEEDSDYEKLLQIISDIKTDMEFQLYAYCFMTNHVHLFINEKNPFDIKKIMHRILTKYVMYYNYKYQRSGSLVANRYKSEPIENEKYYFSLIRYIHQNPTKAGIVNRQKDYTYSSYNDYLKQDRKYTDIDFYLEMLSANRKEAIEFFVDFHRQIEDKTFFINDSKKTTDEQLKRKLLQITKNIKPKEIAALPKIERNNLISKLREEGFTIGQLERLTGISRGIITRAK